MDAALRKSRAIETKMHLGNRPFAVPEARMEMLMSTFNEDRLQFRINELYNELQLAKEAYTKLSNHAESAVELLRRYAQEDPPMGTWLASEFVRKHDGIPVAGRKGPL